MQPAHPFTHPPDTAASPPARPSPARPLPQLPQPAQLPQLPQCLSLLSIPSVPPLLRAAAVEAAVLSGHLLLYPTGLRAERLPGAGEPSLRLPTEGRTAPPALLLHGLFDNRSVFVLLRRALRKHGWRHVHALNHSPLTGDIRAAAERLGEHVERVLEHTGHRRLDLVGHSLGGLIGRYYVQRLGGDARVRTVITLGTPHSGTRLAPALLVHPVARQLCPGSSVLRELAAPVPEGCRSRFVCFWSSLDALMIPSETARLDHSDLRVSNVHVHGVGHLTLPVDSGVSARIREELGGEIHDRPAAPEVADVAGGVA
ncbi:esterase/lipase family protein [Streptomyces sp. NBC_01187]|uniref:esterase/lipase family protein n=1 Tax=Streptomyces sp. NBC_01187 TaxID=2903766 RepID=UPI00386BF4C2